MSIPKIIHQLWIGPKTPPTTLMDTWKDKHKKEGFEYIRWTETELNKRGFKTELENKINEIEEINGKADIIRWELLYKYGGVFIDADSICIEPLTYLVNKYKAFAGYENEYARGKGWAKRGGYEDVLGSTHPLIATGTMGFPPKHPLCKMAIEWIKKNEISNKKTGTMAWRTVGPGLLTRLYFSKKWKDITILPSYSFLPIHCTGLEYKQHGKIYAYQEWGSTKNSYDKMNNVSLPKQFLLPSEKVSILISSYNTKASYVKECLESIKNQYGFLFFEIIWINDGSDTLHTNLLKRLLENFENNTRFVKVIYNENECNKGIGFTLNKGIKLCNNEIIIKMDSDDIMFPDRIIKQYVFMKENPKIAICGAQLLMFKEKINNVFNKTNHSNISWNYYVKNRPHWFINHPTVCYRKSKVLEIGNYNTDLKIMAEDFELELRMLKKYKFIYNFPEPLLYYRIHKDQVTFKGGAKSGGSKHWNNVRNKLINDIINN